MKRSRRRPYFGDWPELPRRWEIADIGFLVLFRQRGRLIRSKVALLQSKRLYPDELEWDEDSPLDYIRGFGRLFRHDDDWGEVIRPRNFSFTPESRYKALMTGVHQYQAIAQYETQRNVPVYYGRHYSKPATDRALTCGNAGQECNFV